eukprot:6488297-Amphidinium_carterae.3
MLNVCSSSPGDEEDAGHADTSTSGSFLPAGHHQIAKEARANYVAKRLALCQVHHHGHKVCSSDVLALARGRKNPAKVEKKEKVVKKAKKKTAGCVASWVVLQTCHFLILASVRLATGTKNVYSRAYHQAENAALAAGKSYEKAK